MKRVDAAEGKGAAAAIVPATIDRTAIASSSTSRLRVVVIVGVLAGIVLLGAVWRFGPLAGQIDPAALSRLAAPLTSSPWLPLAILLAFVLGGLIVIPLTLMIAATVLLCGPVLGAIYALTCATLSSVVIYFIGRALGRDTLRQLGGARINALSRALAARGVRSVFLIRVLPIAPFTLVNLIAGASHIRLRDFAAGTFLGLTPGTMLIVFFVDRLVEAARRPGWLLVALILAAIGVIVTLIVLRRRVSTSSSSHAPPSPSEP